MVDSTPGRTDHLTTEWSCLAADLNLVLRFSPIFVLFLGYGFCDPTATLVFSPRLMILRIVRRASINDDGKRYVSVHPFPFFFLSLGSKSSSLRHRCRCRLYNFSIVLMILVSVNTFVFQAN